MSSTFLQLQSPSLRNLFRKLSVCILHTPCTDKEPKQTKEKCLGQVFFKFSFYIPVWIWLQFSTQYVLHTLMGPTLYLVEQLLSGVLAHQKSIELYMQCILCIVYALYIIHRIQSLLMIMLSLYEPGYIHNNNKKVLENNVLKVYTKLKLYIFPRPSTLTQYPGEREKTTSNIV